MTLKYFSCAFMNFHHKISNFQSLIFSQFRCEIQVFFVCINFHLLFVNVSEEKERKKIFLSSRISPHFYTYTTLFLSPQRLISTTHKTQSLSCWDRRGPRYYCVRIVSYFLPVAFVRVQKITMRSSLMEYFSIIFLQQDIIKKKFWQ